MSCELKNILWSGKKLVGTEEKSKGVKGMQTKFDVGDKVFVEGVVESMKADSDGLVYIVDTDVTCLDDDDLVVSYYRLECAEDKLVGRVVDKCDIDEEVLLIPRKSIISTEFDPDGIAFRVVLDGEYTVNSITYDRFIQMIKENGEEK